jgi:hypothetical protein
MDEKTMASAAEGVLLGSRLTFWSAEIRMLGFCAEPVSTTVPDADSGPVDWPATAEITSAFHKSGFGNFSCSGRPTSNNSVDISLSPSLKSQLPQLFFLAAGT